MAWNAQSDLADGIYVVTGSTQGIGAAIALRLAGRGARGIVICGRNRTRGKSIAAGLTELGAEAVFVPADLADIAACRAVIGACEQRFGRIDGLVNAAGLTERGSLDDTTPEIWERLFAVNARAPFFLIQHAVKLMRRTTTPGSIVNILTMSSYGGQPKLAPYSASKGALAVLTKNLAYALRAERIRVNGLNIGWADTPNEHQVQLAEGQPVDWLEAAEASQPFGQLIKPDDVARMVLFLLSKDSGVMTGSVIEYDQMVMGGYD